MSSYSIERGALCRDGKPQICPYSPLMPGGNKIRPMITRAVCGLRCPLFLLEDSATERGVKKITLCNGAQIDAISGEQGEEDPLAGSVS